MISQADYAKRRAEFGIIEPEQKKSFCLPMIFLSDPLLLELRSPDEEIRGKKPRTRKTRKADLSSMAARANRIRAETRRSKP
jgi:hypothetical protein